ncbi:MAG: capsular biosynthesis protein [Finegoldia sp.]|nr:capsular biosynthesis protein [Finegoldia sp.]
MKQESLLKKAVREKFGQILIVGIIGAILFVAYDVMFVRPSYLVDSKVMINSQNAVGEVEVETTKTLAKSRTILTELKNTLGLRDNLNQLSDKIELSDDKSSLVTIYVEDTVVQRAKDIADQLADILAKEAGQSGLDISVAEYSVTPTKFESPKIVRDALIGFGLGLVVGLIIALIRQSGDDLLRSDSPIEELGVNIIGDIPYIEKGSVIIDE